MQQLLTIFRPLLLTDVLKLLLIKNNIDKKLQMALALSAVGLLVVTMICKAEQPTRMISVTLDQEYSTGSPGGLVAPVKV